MFGVPRRAMMLIRVFVPIDMVGGGAEEMAAFLLLGS
jgi:hypothetical protein